MKKFLIVSALVSLAACTSPAERCISNATDGLPEIDEQIAEAQLNVSRGYRIEDSVIDTFGVDLCSRTGNVRLCLGGTRDIPGRKVPINVSNERERLAALQNQRASMIARSEREIAACQALG